MPAESAGILPGDIIKRLDGNDIKTWEELTTFVKSKPDFIK